MDPRVVGVKGVNLTSIVNYWQAYISWKRGPIQPSFEVDLLLLESNAVLDSGFHAVDCVFQVLDFSGLGFWIPIVSGILDSLSCIPDSKAQDSAFHIPEISIPDSWKVGRLNQNRFKVAPKAKFPTGLGRKNGWAVPGVFIEPVDEKLTWIPHVLELKKSFVKKPDLLKK